MGEQKLKAVAIERTRAISGNGVTRYNALRVFADLPGGQDETPASVRARAKLFALLAEGTNWDRLSLVGVRTLDDAEALFSVEMNAAQAQAWLSILSNALRGRTFEQQRVLLPLIDQLEAFIEDRPSPVEEKS